jgi:aminocarboxymuconate-semialdehyde decarboxylase
MMSTRRNFLKGVGAGLVFCGCGIPMASHAQNAPARLPVMVKGKRVKTIDTHAHCFFREAIDLSGEKLEAVQPRVRGVSQLFFTVEERLKEMDDMAIDMEILSINPFWYRK